MLISLFGRSSRILDITKLHFEKTKHCSPHGDDGTAAFNNNLKFPAMTHSSREPNPKNSVNRLAGGNCPQVTCSMWPDKSRREKPTEQNDPKTQIETANFLSHPDTELVWESNRNLSSECISNQTNN